VLNRCSWTTREELRVAIVSWIERTYHRRRAGRTAWAGWPPSSTRSHDRTGHPGRRVTTRCDLSLQ
jgi:hypothetical protein